MQSICDCIIPSNIPDVRKGTPKKWIASDLCQQEIWIPRGWKGEKPNYYYYYYPKVSLSVLFIYFYEYH